MKRFSALISVYWKENPLHLMESLKSMYYCQSLKPSEIVLIEDGPLSDDLYRVIQNFADDNPDLLRIVKLKENVGLGKALKIGVQHCSYEIIARMDSDDICNPRRFEKQIKFLEDNPKIDIVGSWIKEFIKNPEEIAFIRKVPITYSDIIEFAKFRNPMNHMTVVYKKAAILKAGNYRQFPLFEDYYLWLRMLMNNAKFANIPECLVFVRIGNDMLNRRRGINYLNYEIKLQKEMLNMGFISYRVFLRNLLFRGVPRLVPGKLLKFIYKNFARN